MDLEIIVERYDVKQLLMALAVEDGLKQFARLTGRTYYQSFPVFFKQKRVGQNGRVFTIYKYRTMVSDAESKLSELKDKNELTGAVFKMENDPRVTRVGRFLRKTSLDEFPQFQDCAELQKLYLADSAKGRGLGYRLISFIEDKMSEAGYKFSYLETHSNLKAAIHIYGKSGYSKIARPEGVVHGAMTDFFFKDIQRC